MRVLLLAWLLDGAGLGPAWKAGRENWVARRGFPRLGRCGTLVGFLVGSSRVPGVLGCRRARVMRQLALSGVYLVAVFDLGGADAFAVEEVAGR